MKATVKPGVISGTITAPASKSAMQRACAAALIKGGTTILSNPGNSADDIAALDIIQKLGATVEQKGGQLIIKSNGIKPVADEINCGESGLSVRMFTSIASTSAKQLKITGTGSLVKRPLDFFNEVLPQLDVKCESNGGLLPLTIQGPLKPKNIEVDGSLSSQFLTGLLFAYSAANASDVAIKVRNLNSKPYVDLTLQLMEAFGLKTPINRNYEEFYFPSRSISQYENDTINYSVEGDWSGGAFLLIAGAIAGSITVKGLSMFSAQADLEVLKAMADAGAGIDVHENEIVVTAKPLKAFTFNATDCPDLFPPLVALASFCDGTTEITGVSRLAHKESNRALTLQEEFGKMGVQIQLDGDRMLIKGGSAVKAANVHSRHDHRIAMACAVAALRANGQVTIEEAEAVNKSYPDFWNHLQRLNVNVSLSNNADQ
jgi:3-phosphoshikimate 1-carboxyvinyltransferase